MKLIKGLVHTLTVCESKTNATGHVAQYRTYRLRPIQKLLISSYRKLCECPA